MRKKILNHTCLLVVLSVLMTFLAASLVMYSKYNEDLKQSVRDSTKYIQDSVEKMGESYLDKDLGKASAARITLLDSEGNVLFDSLEDPMELANHSNRPEFIQAEKEGYAETLRYSETLSKQNFYCAVKLSNGDILRVGRTTDSVFSTMVSSSALFGALLLLILVLAFILVRKQTQDLIEPINTLDLEHPLGEVRYEELRPLLERVDEQNHQIAKQMEELKEAEAVRREFSANVSHELKTPIALVQGYAEGLKENISDDPESREFYCDVIMDEAAKMNKLVKNLLTLNQLESGRDEVTMERFDIVSLIRGVLQSMDIMIQQKEAKVNFEASDPVYVWADEFKIEEVVTNYTSNALNHLNGEKEIEIRVLPEDDRVRVTVFNTGTPIPEEDIPKLWNKFYKVDKARTREYGGSGIGLSIVKAIMESLHQQYGVQNYDNGVEFWFTLDRKND